MHYGLLTPLPFFCTISLTKQFDIQYYLNFLDIDLEGVYSIGKCQRLQECKIIHTNKRLLASNYLKSFKILDYFR